MPNCNWRGYGYAGYSKVHYSLRATRRAASFVLSAQCWIQMNHWFEETVQEQERQEQQTLLCCQPGQLLYENTVCTHCPKPYSGEWIAVRTINIELIFNSYYKFITIWEILYSEMRISFILCIAYQCICTFLEPYTIPYEWIYDHTFT